MKLLQAEEKGKTGVGFYLQYASLVLGTMFCNHQGRRPGTRSKVNLSHSMKNKVDESDIRGNIPEYDRRSGLLFQAGSRSVSGLLLQ